MDFTMAYIAKGNEIFFHIASLKASRLNVMNLEIFGTSASLTSPAVALKHLPAKPLPAALSRDARSHDACGIRNKNSWRCEFGSNR
jgi:hypothetical protein